LRNCGGGTEHAYHSIVGALGIVKPGDVVVIQPGTYEEVIKPTVSGTADKPIIFKAQGEVIVNAASYDPRGATHPSDPNLYYGPIWLEDVSHIVFDGLTVTNPEGYVRSVRSNFITFKNCTFQGPTSDWIIGIHLFESHDNQFINNRISGASDNVRLIHSDRNLIVGNEFTDARHVLLTLKCSSHNVVRENYFYNALQKNMEVYDCEQPTMFDHYNIPYYQDTQILDATKSNLIEKNTFAFTAPDDGDGPFNHIQYAGQNGIIRNNLFYNSNGTALGMTIYPDEAMYNRFNRVYHNVFFNNVGSGIVTGDSSDPLHFVDNIFKNNVLYQNKAAPVGWADDYPGGSQVTHRI